MADLGETLIDSTHGHGLTIISIHLDGSEDCEEYIFHAGQTVSGHVRVETTEEIRMRGIWVEVKGEARVQWWESSGQHIQSYTGHESYINLRTYVTGSDDKDSEMMLTPGVHTLPLSFLLPDNIPSSFEWLYGTIKYRVQAGIYRPWQSGESTEIFFSVVRLLDLNNEPQLREPIELKEEKPTVECCYYCCCIKGLPEIELKINRGGFVPGETIVLSGQVINTSNTRLENITINFIQEMEFCANYGDQIRRRKRFHKILDSTKRPQIESGCTDTWSDVTFTVPPVLASRLDGCNIINISYLIQVKADFFRGCSDCTAQLGIVIGDIPLQESFQCGGPISTQPSTFTSPFQAEAPFPEQSNQTGAHC